ncbi:MAG: hypothetical protein JO120_06655 [Solirubrobacterales bacterium]|nr:hypothetical protein [Solirubrobacterales bacterium]
MDSTTTFPIGFDRPSRIPMTVLGAGPNVSRVKVSSSTIDIRVGWAFQATIPRETVASARPLNRGLSEVPGPLGLSVLRGVNYWRGTALVNGAGTGLVEITLDRPKRVRLGPLQVRMRRLIVSAEDQSGLVAALNPSPPRPPGSGDPSL